MNQAHSLLPSLAISSALLAWGLEPVGLPDAFAEALTNAGRNEADLDRMEIGYYENLLASTRRFEHLNAPAPPPPFKETRLARKVADPRECVLVPNLETVQQGARWSTNALGLRDRPYDVDKPPGTRRVLLIGDSIGVGWGVDDGLGFEPILERRLGERSRARGGPTIEILNLCVPGYSPGQRYEHLQRVGWDLEPDLVLYQGTAADVSWDERRLRALLPQGVGWESPFYRRAIDEADLQRGDGPETIKRGLKPRRWIILEDVYRCLVEDASARGVAVGWILLPRIGRSIDVVERNRLVALARSAGFDPVIDLTDTFADLEPARLAIGPNDYHPNVRGHALLADRLEAALGDVVVPDTSEGAAR